MTSSRGQNLFIVQQPGSQPWEPPITAFSSTEGSLRNASRYDSSRLDSKAKTFGVSSCKSSSGENAVVLQTRDRTSVNKFPNAAATAENVSFSSVLGSVDRELSPVRWCDREVDGVYLGKSGWVQVQQKSQDNSKKDICIENSSACTLPFQRKLVNCKFDERSNRPANLPLSMKKRPNRGRSSDFSLDFGSASPPSITPIISPPPAFKDGGLNVPFPGKSTGKPFIWDESFLSESGTLEDCKSSFPEKRATLNLSSSHRVKPVPRASPLRYGSNYKSLHTKSLEDDEYCGSRCHRRNCDSSTPLTTLRFRSLDSDRVTYPVNVNFNEDIHKNFENSGKKICDKRKKKEEEEMSTGEKEDSERPDSNGHLVCTRSSCEELTGEKPSVYRQRNCQRNGRRTSYDIDTVHRTRSSSVESSSSSNSGDSSFSCKNPEKLSCHVFNSNQRQSENVHGKDGSHFFVKRSRSLQLTEKRSPCELILLNHSSSGKSWDAMPPEPPTYQVKNQNGKCPGQFPQRLHHVLVTVKGESIPVIGSSNQSLKSLSKITTSETEQKKLIVEAEKEARIISEYLNGTRSRAAARNLLLHRYFNQPETRDFTEVAEKDNFPTAEDDSHYLSENQRSFVKPNDKKNQRPVTTPEMRQNSTPVYLKSFAPVARDPGKVFSRGGSFTFFQNQSDERPTKASEKQIESRSSFSLHPEESSDRHSMKGTIQNTNRSLPDQDCAQKDKLFHFLTHKQKPKKNVEKVKTDHKCLPKNPTSYWSALDDRAVTEDENLFDENSPMSSSSSSSSSSSCSDICPRNFRTEPKKPEKKMATRSYLKKKASCSKSRTVEEVGHGPPDSSGKEEQISPGLEHKSLSLPRSFLSERFAVDSSSQRDFFGWKQEEAEPFNEVSSFADPGILQSSRTAPTTPVRDLRYDKSTENLNEAESVRRSSVSLYDEPSFMKPRDVFQKVSSENFDSSLECMKERGPEFVCKTPRKIPDGLSETVLKKLRKNLTLKYLKGKGNTKINNRSVSQETEGENSDASNDKLSDFATDFVPTLQALGNGHEIPESSSLRQSVLGLRSNKERNKGNKMFRNEKYGSHDSGIQMGNRGYVDSSESQDTDMQEDTDSPLTVRRRQFHGNKNFCRPQSDVFNQVLIDRFKADLQWRSKMRRQNGGKGVRRTNSDLGGQRLFNWELKNHNRRLVFCSPVPRGAQEKTFTGSSSTDDSPSFTRSVMVLRPRLRRSLSQPLGLDELSKCVRPKTSMLKNFAVSEDEKHPLEKNYENGFLSDSESSVGSLNERKKATELGSREEATILAEAVWDHVAMESWELPFRAGDVIEVLDTRDRDWWWGATMQNIGYFPSAFVRLRVSQEDTVEDCLAAMAKGKHGSSQLRRGKSISLLSNDQVRSSIVRELLNTERDFVKILRDLKEGYVVQCKKRSDMFTSSQIGAIFSNIEDLLVYQEKFLMDLESRVDSEFPYKSCIGEVFLNHGSSFQMYSEYCNSHPMAIATLQDLYQKNNYCKFFEMCRLRQNLIEIPLDGYLLTPVQRICKYPLQLAELLKYTKPDHPDFKKVEEALETMRSVATMINERKRKMESLEKLAAWQQRVEGWEGEDLIEVSSRLIHQGDVVRITSGMWTTNITLFLFDHQIVYCKKDLLKRNVFIYKGRLFLDTSDVVDVPDGKNQQLGITVKYGLKIISTFKDKWFLFCCRSSEDKDGWLKAFAEERKLVAQDKEVGLDLPPAAKKLAKLAARTKHCPPNKPRGKNKFACSHEMMILRNGPSGTSKPKSSRKMGNWFTFGGTVKNSKPNFRSRASLH